MPFLKDPDAEARRIEAVRRASTRRGRWAGNTGPRTVGGKRKMAINATRHGAGSLAFQLALRYCDSVLASLRQ